MVTRLNVSPHLPAPQCWSRRCGEKTDALRSSDQRRYLISTAQHQRLCAISCGLDALTACHMRLCFRWTLQQDPQRQRRHTVRATRDHPFKTPFLASLFPVLVPRPEINRKTGFKGVVAPTEERKLILVPRIISLSSST